MYVCNSTSKEKGSRKFLRLESLVMWAMESIRKGGEYATKELPRHAPVSYIQTI
jgi:hypothetical protein